MNLKAVKYLQNIVPEALAVIDQAAIDKAVENAEIVELPEEMIHEEVHRSVNEFLGNLR